MRTVLGRIDKKRNVGNSLEEHNISRLIFWSDHFCGVEFYRNRWGRSFNYRKTWAPKVTKIMKNTGLLELSKSLYVGNKTFNELW